MDNEEKIRLLSKLVNWEELTKEELEQIQPVVFQLNERVIRNILTS